MLASRCSPLLFVLVAGLVAIGCSSTSEDAEAGAATGAFHVASAVSGSRLHARFLTGSGARQLAGFHDAERNEDCTFQAAEPGHTRCLPLVAGVVQSGVFGDAACTNLVASLGTCSASAGYAMVYRYDQASCANVVSELRKVAGPTTTTYVSSPGGCVAQGTPPAGSLVTLGDVVPWTAFVEASESIVPGDVTSERVLVGADGSRQHVGFQIDASGAKCAFQVMPDGVARCVPDARSGPVAYGDTACKKPLFVNDYSSGCQTEQGASSFWVEPALDACGGARVVYSLAEPSGGDVAPYDELYSPSLSTSSSGASVTVACTSIGSGSPTRRRAITADVTGALPSSARSGAGDDRLVPALVATPTAAGAQASAALTLGWHDKQRDADCTFELASDGKQRCLPSGPRATVFHTDATCNSPSLVAVLDEAPCIASRFVRLVSATCPSTTRVFEVGTSRRDLTTGSITTATGACRSLSGINNAADATELDPATFVEGALVNE